MFYLWFLFLHIFLGRILKLSLGHSFDRKFLNCRAKDRGTNGCRDHPKTIINGSFTWLLALIILKSRIPCDTLHPIIHYCETVFKSGLCRSKSRKTLIRIKKEPQFITIHHLARPKSNEIIFYGTSYDQLKFISDFYGISNMNFENRTFQFYRLLTLFCLVAMSSEMVIKVMALTFPLLFGGFVRRIWALVSSAPSGNPCPGFTEKIFGFESESDQRSLWKWPT